MISKGESSFHFAYREVHLQWICFLSTCHISVFLIAGCTDSQDNQHMQHEEVLLQLLLQDATYAKCERLHNTWPNHIPITVLFTLCSGFVDDTNSRYCFMAKVIEQLLELYSMTVKLTFSVRLIVSMLYQQ